MKRMVELQLQNKDWVNPIWCGSCEFRSQTTKPMEIHLWKAHRQKIIKIKKNKRFT
jgi:hypothetical protein